MMETWVNSLKMKSEAKVKHYGLLNYKKMGWDIPTCLNIIMTIKKYHTTLLFYLAAFSCQY